MIRKTLLFVGLAMTPLLSAGSPVADEGQTYACTDTPFQNQLAAHYEVHARYGFLTLDGDASLAFSRQGTEYALETELTAMGGLSTRQTSSGFVEAGVLLPTQYSEKRPRRQLANVSIDWGMQQVEFASGSQLPTRQQLQDRASMLVQLSAVFRAQPDVVDIELPVANTRHIDTYRFERRGTEPIETPLGTLSATRYAHIDSDDGDKLDIWLAPEQCGAPVRILVRNHKGYEVDQRIRSLSAQ